MTRYTITGIFAIDTEAEDARDAKALATQKLKEACIKHCVTEVIRSAEEKPKRRAASEAKTVIQNQIEQRGDAI